MAEVVEDKSADGVHTLVGDGGAQLAVHVVNAGAAVHDVAPAAEVADLACLAEPGRCLVQQPVGDLLLPDHAFEAAVFVGDEHGHGGALQVLVERVEHGQGLGDKRRAEEHAAPVGASRELPGLGVEHALDHVGCLAVKDDEAAGGLLEGGGDFLRLVVHGHEGEVHARHHAVAHGEGFDVERLAQHFGLVGAEQALLLAHFDQGLELVAGDLGVQLHAAGDDALEQQIGDFVRPGGEGVEHGLQRHQQAQAALEHAGGRAGGEEFRQHIADEHCGAEDERGGRPGVPPCGAQRTGDQVQAEGGQGQVQGGGEQQGAVQVGEGVRGDAAQLLCHAGAGGLQARLDVARAVNGCLHGGNDGQQGEQGEIQDGGGERHCGQCQKDAAGVKRQGWDGRRAALTRRRLW